MGKFRMALIGIENEKPNNNKEGPKKLEMKKQMKERKRIQF